MTTRTVLHISQYTNLPVLEETLTDADGSAIDLSDAEAVTITTEHINLGFSGVSDASVEIVDASEGTIRYQFSPEQVALEGQYSVQFDIQYADGTTELVPGGSDRDWLLIVGRRLAADVPATFDEVVAETVDTDELLVGVSQPVTRLNGPNLTITDQGELAGIDPVEDGYTAGADHTHDASGNGGDSLYPAIVGSESDPVDSGVFNQLALLNAPTESTDLLRQAELTAHEDDAGAHHPEKTDSDIINAVDGANIDISGTAASANYADNAGHADTATSADSATSANTAQTAETATNAENLGGNPPSYYTDESTVDLSGYVQSPTTTRLWTRNDDPAADSAAPGVQNNDIWMQPDPTNNRVIGHVRVNGSWLEMAGTTDDGSGGGDNGGGGATGVVDNFERGDLAPYVLTEGTMEVVGAAAHSGSYGLRMFDAGGGLRSAEGLSNYPSAGDDFELWIQMSETGGTANLIRVEFALGSAQNSNNCYRFQMNTNSMNFSARESAADNNLLTFTNATFPVGTWRRIRVNWGTDGSFSIAVYNENNALMEEQSITNTAHTGGGIGFWTNATTGLYADDWSLI